MDIDRGFQGRGPSRDLQLAYVAKLKLRIGGVARRKGWHGIPLVGSEPRSLLGAGHFLVPEGQTSTSPKTHCISKAKDFYLCVSLASCPGESARRVQSYYPTRAGVLAMLVEGDLVPDYLTLYQGHGRGNFGGSMGTRGQEWQSKQSE